MSNTVTVTLTLNGAQFVGEMRSATDAAEDLTDTLDDAGQAGSDAGRGLRETASAADAARDAAEDLSNRAGVLGKWLSSLGTAGLVAAAGLGAMVLVAGKGAAEAERMQTLALRTEAVITATRGAAGYITEDIRSLSEELALATLASVDGMERAAQKLMTFRAVSRSIFAETLELAQDLAATGIGSLESNVLQLGKALQDPVEGINALKRSGVSFTASQREMIESLVATNQVAAAQEIILSSLREQVGGAGRAEAGGLAGAYDTLGQRVSKFFEIVGNAGPIQFTTAAINLMADAVHRLNQALGAGGVEAQFADMTDRRDWLRDKISSSDDPRVQSRLMQELTRAEEERLAYFEQHIQPLRQRRQEGAATGEMEQEKLAVDALGDSYQSLAKSLDPSIAAQEVFRQSIEVLGAALDKGIITQEEYDTRVAQVHEAYKKATQGADENTKATRANTNALDAAYASTLAGIQRKIALHGQEGEVAQMVYETELGQLSALDAARKEHLVQWAKALEQVQDTGLIESMAEELALTKLTARERAAATAVMRLSSQATAEQVEQVRELAYALYDQQEAAEQANATAVDWGELMTETFGNLVSGVQDSFVSLFEGIFSGGVDSFGDFAEQIKKLFIRLLAELAATAATNWIMINLGLGMNGSLTGGGLLGMLGGGQGGGLLGGNPMSLINMGRTGYNWMFGGGGGTSGVVSGAMGGIWGTGATTGFGLAGGGMAGYSALAGMGTAGGATIGGATMTGVQGAMWSSPTAFGLTGGTAIGGGTVGGATVGGAAGGGAGAMGGLAAAAPYLAIAAIAIMAIMGSKKPPNRGAGGVVDFDDGTVRDQWGETGKKAASPETIAARDAFLASTSTFAQSLARITGEEIEGWMALDVGERDGWQVNIDGQMSTFETYDEAMQHVVDTMLERAEGVSEAYRTLLENAEPSRVAEFAAALATVDFYSSGKALEAYRAALENADQTAWDVLTAEHARVQGLVASYDGSVDATVELAAELANLGAAAIQVAADIRAAVAQFNQASMSFEEQIRMDQMTAEEQYDYLREQAEQHAQNALSEDDPYRAAEEARLALEYAQAAYNALSEEERQEVGDDYLAAIEAFREEYNAAQQERIDDIEGAADPERDGSLAAQVQDALAAAAEQFRQGAEAQQASAEEMGAAAKDVAEAASQIVGASNALAAAVSEIPDRIDVVVQVREQLGY